MRMAIWVLSAVVGVAVIGAASWMWFVNNVEHPKYVVEKSDGEIELRRYPALVVAEVTRDGERWSAANAGFRPLAGYIFARQRPGDKIAMTAPVIQVPADTPPTDTSPTDKAAASATKSDTRWTISFIMPSQYKLTDLPEPESDDVRLRKLPSQTRVAIRFSGVATDAAIARNEVKLRQWADANGIALDGPPTIAYYNDPFTPGFLRRNEVLFDVKS